MDTFQAALDAERSRRDAQEDAVTAAVIETRMTLALAREAHTGAQADRDDAAREIEKERERMAVFDIDTHGGIIDIDVGGEVMRTYRRTLQGAGGLLEAMFSGRHKPSLTKEGRYFIDCDPRAFTRLLKALRIGDLQHCCMDDDVDALIEYFALPVPGRISLP